MKERSRGIATVRRRSAAGTAVITVGVRLEAGEFSVRSDFEHQIVLQPTSECAKQFPSNESLFRCCEGAAQSGVFYATRGQQDKCGCVVLTRFDGTSLPPDCGMGFATAAALACFHAMGHDAPAHQMDMQDWEEV